MQLRAEAALAGAAVGGAAEVRDQGCRRARNSASGKVSYVDNHLRYRFILLSGVQMVGRCWRL